MSKQAAERLAEIASEIEALGDGQGPWAPGHEEAGRYFYDRALSGLLAERDEIVVDPAAYDARQAAHAAAIDACFDLDAIFGRAT